MDNYGITLFYKCLKDMRMLSTKQLSTLTSSVRACDLSQKKNIYLIFFYSNFCTLAKTFNCSRASPHGCRYPPIWNSVEDKYMYGLMDMKMPIFNSSENHNILLRDLNMNSCLKLENYCENTNCTIMKIFLVWKHILNVHICSYCVGLCLH